MNIGHIDGNYYVSPQLSPDQMEEIANLGFVSIICNRPDFEVPDSIGSSVIGEFAKNLGIEFHILELTRQLALFPLCRKLSVGLFQTNSA